LPPPKNVLISPPCEIEIASQGLSRSFLENMKYINGVVKLRDDDNSVLGLGVNPDFDDAAPYA
jgi:hypothetical protein